jgi:1-acyl-sn-glycerol-3-phosphate acyltransferase
VEANQWRYKPAPDLERSLAERLRTFPRYPDMTLYAGRAAMQLVMRSYLKVYHRLVVHGRQNLPLNESFVMVCNHTSHLDTVSLLAALPLRRVHRAFPAAAADYFFSSVPRSALSVLFVNALPFDRQARGAESLEVCRELLARRRHALILFPEGTRTQTGEVGPFKSGIARLVAGERTPVVPCYLDGGFGAFPKGALFPRPRRLTLRIGRPIRFPDDAPEDREAIARICTTLREAVVGLAPATARDEEAARPYSRLSIADVSQRAIGELGAHRAEFGWLRQLAAGNGPIVF